MLSFTSFKNFTIGNLYKKDRALTQYQININSPQEEWVVKSFKTDAIQFNLDNKI